MNIYVANILFTVTESELRKQFEEFGEVDSVKIILDKETRKSRGFGFVEMPNNAEANAAISALNGSVIGTRTLAVNEARPVTARA